MPVENVGKETFEAFNRFYSENALRGRCVVKAPKGRLLVQKTDKSSILVHTIEVAGNSVSLNSLHFDEEGWVLGSAFREHSTKIQLPLSSSLSSEAIIEKAVLLGGICRKVEQQQSEPVLIAPSRPASWSTPIPVPDLALAS